MTEKELAKTICDWLKYDGWEVYQEVRCLYGVVDMVAVRENISWIIETKTSLSLQLLEQVLHRRGMSNFISIGIPQKKKIIEKYRAILNLMKQECGLGNIAVHNSGVTEITQPSFNRIRFIDIREYLHDEQKYWCEAGTACGGYFTPFAATKKALIRYVQKNCGCELRVAIKELEHHYGSHSTAKTCIAKYVKKGVISELKAKGRPLRLYMNNEVNDGKD